ncbi:MarR family transcriptional regulator [Actinoplanes lobatus]|uniref:GNAT superfamily N-acetyltransferase n=1 Tax=Actinoplanes lobatus TaxID=113568 RepID=A0A7W7MKF2_9ACTN|nr:GNAT family N-acetyltransferase [Actinoplanes lobatus]MBB4753692.1 GNAT superfamily N-acetyltransferase [Actinoplanes lobatus]GGN72983.1 MarR family transcriptional regulator [Actinoplanes lobatus]GIE44497.1 MarR family transcriptional regulator [Actinoplanes lobatus]
MTVLRRADRPGDLGWIVMAHGEEYQRQFGWDAGFEALVARIVADYAAGHDRDREAAWIAETGGERSGCVMLAAGDEPGTAKLRVLLVTGAARGGGVGSRLVGECLAFAEKAGYREVTLWTVDLCVSARRIYEAAGFTLRAQEPHPGFGGTEQVTGQTWAKRLGYLL